MSDTRKYKSTFLREERDRALFEVYCSALETQNFKYVDDAYDYIRMHPAPKFYIEPEYLRHVIFRKNRGLPIKADTEVQRKFDELYERYLLFRQSDASDGKTLMDILYMLVNSPAPEFYISRRTTRMIIARQRKKQWESMVKKSQLC